MSILIKGMEMPERCWDCHFCDYEQDGCYCDLTQKDVPRWTPTPRPDDCPLVELSPPCLVFWREGFISVEGQEEKQHDG